MKIILAIIGLLVIGAGLAVAVKPDLMDLIIPPPPPKNDGVLHNLLHRNEPKEDPGMLDRIRAANAKAEEERRKKQEEEEAAANMMMMGVGATLVLGVVIGALFMMRSSSSGGGGGGGGGGDSTNGASDSDADKRYGRYVKEKDLDGDAIYSSHRLDSKNSS